MNVCTAVTATIVLSAGLFLSCSSGEPNNVVDRPGGIIVALSSFESWHYEGRLLAFDPGGTEGRLLAEDVSIAAFPPVAPQGTTLPYVEHRRDVEDDNDEWRNIRLIDIRTGDSREFAEGSLPIASADRVAFCRGDELLVASFAEPNNTSLVATTRNCLPRVWRDGVLTFLRYSTSSEDPLEDPLLPADQLTAYVWDDEIKSASSAPETVPGYGELTISSDGNYLLYSNLESVVEIDLESGSRKIIGTGLFPVSSPVDNDVYAVLMKSGEIEVRHRSGGVVAKSQFDLDIDFTRMSFAWSPDGAAIAVPTPSCIEIWFPETGARNCIGKPPQGEEFMSAILWFDAPSP